MKKFLPVFMIIATFAIVVSPISAATNTGNGAISGTHYNLNLIGMPKGKTADMTNDGHRIFVNLDSRTKINLQEGPTFAVLDANGTDANGARFQLPNPDPDNDGVTVYRVYARALGKPGGSANMTTCGMSAGLDGVFGTADDEEVCSVATLKLYRSKGKSTFTDVSKYLLYIYADMNLDGVAERYPLFDPALQGYFWDYDNNGLKNVQLRFYMEPTTVPATM